MNQIDVDIKEYGYNFEGIAKVDTLVYFVDDAMKDEKVKIQVENVSKKFAQAKACEIINPSKFRVKPLCKYYGDCGGCQCMHIEYEETLKIKSQIIKNTLNRVGKINCECEPCTASEKHFGYRNKIELLFGNNGLGYYGKNDIILPIENCPLFDFDIKNIIEIFNNYYFNFKYQNVLKCLVIRKIKEKITLILVKNAKKIENYNFLIDNLLKNKINFNFFVCVNEKNNSTNVTDNITLIYGDSKETVSILGLEKSISANSFLQVNVDVQNLIYKEILSLINENEVVIDAYSGAGLLSGLISKKAKKVFAVEIVKNASKDADQMKEQNKLIQLENICGDCKDILPQILKSQKIDVIVLDPPRAGVNENLIDIINNSSIKKIIYLSCSPSTLARDLSKLNYNIEFVKPYDMFPQTKHIETLVLLSKK